MKGNVCNPTFTHKECLEALHDRGYVCRDVKPSAFVRREGGGGRELMLAELGVARSLK